MICLSLTESRLETAVQVAYRYRSYIDMCELRVDYLLSKAPQAIAIFPRYAQERGVAKSLLTLRRTIDGGQYEGDEDSRSQLMLDILREMPREHPFNYVDIEVDLTGSDYEQEMRALAAEKGVSVICSVHQFSPSAVDIVPLLEQCTAREGDIGKVALKINGMGELCDVITQLLAFRARDEYKERPIIVIAIGPYGQLLRILSHRFHFHIVYCGTENSNSERLGQVDPIALRKLYRYDTITEHTALFGILGHPVQHSRSPQFHNRYFQEEQVDARYLPLMCENIEEWWRLAALLPFRGCSVTLPHKESIIRHLHTQDDDVRAIGSCNTVIMEGERWMGYNTDLYGFELPLRKLGLFAHKSGDESADEHAYEGADENARASSGENMHESAHNNARGNARANGNEIPHTNADESTRTHAPTHRQGAIPALVIGAGGVARTVCHSLLRHTCPLCIINRSSARLHALVHELRSTYPHAIIHAFPLSKESRAQISGFTNLIVHTTSIGMHPHEDDDPIPFYHFDGSEIVYDLIYNPHQTALLQRAERAGCRVISGIEMFWAQAQEQSAYFLKALHSLHSGRSTLKRS